MMIKYVIFSFFAMVGIVFSGTAQENKTVKETKTIKRIVKKVGDSVIVTEVEVIDKVKGAVVVAGGEKVNQSFKEDSTVVKSKNVLVDTTNIDQKNKALVAAEKKRREEELVKSKAEAAAKAEVERKLLEEKKAELQRQLKENRKRLQRGAKKKRKN